MAVAERERERERDGLGLVGVLEGEGRGAFWEGGGDEDHVKALGLLFVWQRAKKNKDFQFTGTL